MRLAFGLCGVLWLPHYWYNYTDIGGVFTSTEVCKKTMHTRFTTTNMDLVETESLTVYASKNLK